MACTVVVRVDKHITPRMFLVDKKNICRVYTTVLSRVSFWRVAQRL